MRIALIGAGRMGRLHAEVLAGHPAVTELLVSDMDPAVARAVASDVGGSVADDPTSAMRVADAVLISAPTDAHASLLRTAIGLGRPTLIEKPLAFELDDCRALMELAEASGVPVQVGFQRQFDTGYVQARQLVASGAVGTLYVVRLIAHDATPPPDAYIPTSGGLFIDSSIHDFDALRFITGAEVEDVYAVGSVRVSDAFARAGDVDTAVAILRLEDGTLATLSQTRHDPRGYDVRMELVGSGEAVSIGLGSHTPTRSLADDALELEEGWTGFLQRFEPAYRAEIEAFLPVARGEAPSPCTARDGYEAMRIAIAATRSLREGRAVRLDDVR